VSSRASNQVRIVSGVNLLLGFFLIISPWLVGDIRVGFDMSPSYSAVTVGALVVVCSGLRITWPQSSAGLSGANIAFGFWILTSPWVFGYSIDTTHTSLSVIIGASIILLGVLSGCVTLRERGERLI
jgi:SPW repeat